MEEEEVEHDGIGKPCDFCGELCEANQELCVTPRARLTTLRCGFERRDWAHLPEWQSVL